MMFKEGKELVISQIFPLGVQSEGLEVDKTQSLQHLYLNLKVVPCKSILSCFGPEKVWEGTRNNLQSYAAIPRLDN